MDGHVLPTRRIYTAAPSSLVTRTCVCCGVTTCSYASASHVMLTAISSSQQTIASTEGSEKKCTSWWMEVLTLGSKRAGQYEDKRRRGADEGPPVHGRVDRNMARIYTVRSPATPSLQQLSVAKLLYLHFFRLRLYLHIYKYNWGII